MKKTIIGVMGPGDDATDNDKTVAYELGKAIAGAGYVTLSGGRNVGVMDAVSRGAQEAGGLTIGVIPSDDPSTVSEGVVLPIMTNMSDARNNINVLTAHVVVVCGMNPGTASEAALAIKWKKPVIMLNASGETVDFFRQLSELSGSRIEVASSIEECMSMIATALPA